MQRNSSSSMGAMHPAFFMLMIYVISFVLAFFVCRMIYNSLHDSPTVQTSSVSKLENFTVMK